MSSSSNRVVPGLLAAVAVSPHCRPLACASVTLLLSAWAAGQVEYFARLGPANPLQNLARELQTRQVDFALAETLDAHLLSYLTQQQPRIGEFEPMCNPIMQANLLNDAETDFNILVGLCVGHDSLFFKYSDAMTTVLVAKDRVLGHNPAAALYTTSTYYARLLRKGIDVPKTDE